MVYHWDRGFAASLWVFSTQILYTGVLSFINWVFFCTKGCPTFSTNELSNWGLGCFVALVVIAIALSVIAVILTCFNWIVVYWILTEDNIYQGRKFLQDIYKHSGIVCIISFIGLLMLVLLGVIPIVLDESQLDIYYYAWNMIYTPYSNASWNVLVLFITIWEFSKEYKRSQDKKVGGITEKSPLLPTSEP